VFDLKLLFKRSDALMNPYYFNPGYIPQQVDYSVQQYYPPYVPQHEEYDERQQLQNLGGFERRIRTLERQNEEQVREITRLNRVVERHTDRINRLNQRLRNVERRLNIPFTASQDGF
jgi:uncharacterized coiled-coil protein SlyX